MSARVPSARTPAESRAFGFASLVSPRQIPNKFGSALGSNKGLFWLLFSLEDKEKSNIPPPIGEKILN